MSGDDPEGRTLRGVELGSTLIAAENEERENGADQLSAYICSCSRTVDSLTPVRM